MDRELLTAKSFLRGCLVLQRFYLVQQGEGMDFLKGKIILVAGGTGTIGEGIVQVLLENGANVIVPSIYEDKLCALRNKNKYKQRLYSPLANMLNLAGTNKLLSWIKVEMGEIDALVTCCSDWRYCTPLLDLSLDTWHK